MTVTYGIAAGQHRVDSVPELMPWGRAITDLALVEDVDEWSFSAVAVRRDRQTLSVFSDFVVNVVLSKRPFREIAETWMELPEGLNHQRGRLLDGQGTVGMCNWRV